MGIITQNSLGSDCSGTTGQTGRILTLSNVALTQANGFQVFKSGALLTLTTDYTITHNDTASTVTFVGALLDAAVLVVQYIQGSTTPSAYCTYTDVYNRTGLSATEVSTAIVDIMIDAATTEIELITGRKFGDGNEVTEYFSSNGADIIGNYQSSVVIAHSPIQSVAEFKLLDMDGTATVTMDTLTAGDISGGTIQTDDYWLEMVNDPLTNTSTPGRNIYLKTLSLPRGVNVAKITYTYGYSVLPDGILRLAADIAGIRCWVRFLGGQYNRLDSYNIPQQGVSKGDFYARGKQNIDELQADADVILDRIGRRSRTLFSATGGFR